MAEVAYLAQMVAWPLDTLLDLEHADRHQFIELLTPPPPNPEQGR